MRKNYSRIMLILILLVFVNNIYSYNPDIRDEKYVIVQNAEFSNNIYAASNLLLVITTKGGGYVLYGNDAIRDKTQSYSISEGSSVTVSFSPDSGYRIKSVSVNKVDVTSTVYNNTYKMNSIKDDVSLDVEFELIPVSYNTLTINVSGNGYASYDETKIRDDVRKFTLKSGTTVTISFNPDSGSKIKRIKIIKSGVTYTIFESQYTIANITEDITINVEFDNNPQTNYELLLITHGNGSISFDNTIVPADSEKSIVISDNTSLTITFLPGNGYRIKSITENGTDVTSSVSFNQYTINNISGNTSIEVEFEAIPVNTYILRYVVDGETYKTYELKEGAAIVPEAVPTKEGYTFSGWSDIPKTMPAEDVTITGTFTKKEDQMTLDGVTYETVSFSEHLVVVAEGDYGPVLEVPETIKNGNETWTVMGLKDGILETCENLAAVIWNPSTVFNTRVSNPNLLLYVKDKAYASYGVKNVIVNGKAESIELTDAISGNDFYCPRAFKAKKISYSHRYNMETGLGDSKGWETIVLPFDVQKYTCPKGEIVPFNKWANTDNTKPFWLFELTASGYKDVEGIKANTPYIISMPNNPQYLSDYVIIGLVTFSAENVEVKASENIQSINYQDRTFVPNYMNQSNDDYFALNVNNYYVTNSSTEKDGSKFVRGLRAIHPFEAYMTTTSNTRTIDVMDDMTTAIRDIIIAWEGTDVIKVFDTRGVLVKIAKANADLRKRLDPGVYIVNGKKVIIK